MKNISISIFFPAYNESKNIKNSVDTALSVIQNITNDFEIIIVNDGSSDDTGIIIDRLSRDNPKIKAVHHKTNQGYGGALLSGIKNSQKEWFFFTDADMQFDIKEINKLIEYIPKYKAVLGYRSPRCDNFLRVINGWGWNMLIRILFNLKIRDVDCAFKLFEKKIIHELPIKTRGATTSAEILIRLSKNKIIWKEVPVSHFSRKFGEPTGMKLKVIAKAFKELFDLYLRGI